MLTINLKSRFRNKTFILAMASAVVLLIQQCGFKDLIPSNYVDIVNSVLTISTMLGIIVDPSTSGLSDQIISSATVQSINADNTKELIKAEGSTTAINNTITENSQSYSDNASASASDKEAEITSSVQAAGTIQVSSNIQNVDTSASSKVTVDNPDNTQQVGVTVSATSAVTPQ